MIDHIKLIGGPAGGRKLEVEAGTEHVTVASRERRDPARPGRSFGRRDCRYRRTDRGVGTGTIPRRYEYVA